MGGFTLLRLWRVSWRLGCGLELLALLRDQALGQRNWNLKSPPESKYEEGSGHNDKCRAQVSPGQDKGGGGTQPGVLPDLEGSSQGDVWNCQAPGNLGSLQVRSGVWALEIAA